VIQLFALSLFPFASELLFYQPPMFVESGPELRRQLIEISERVRASNG